MTTPLISSNNLLTRQPHGDRLHYYTGYWALVVANLHNAHANDFVMDGYFS